MYYIKMLYANKPNRRSHLGAADIEPNLLVLKIHEAGGTTDSNICFSEFLSSLVGTSPRFLLIMLIIVFQPNFRIKIIGYDSDQIV